MNPKPLPRPVAHIPQPPQPEPTTVDEYLDQLEEGLEGCDPALLQDALFDAREHLRAELAVSDRDDVAEALREVIATYGTPQEVAEAYVDAEERTAPRKNRQKQHPTATANLFTRFFAVLLEPYAYTAMLFNVLGLVTGVAFFAWAITGAALSIGLSILIIGLPIALVFLASVRVLARVEGRLVEGLLGVRMPRRPIASEPPKHLVGRILYWLKDRRTWSTWLYLVLRLPMGVLSFVATVTLLALSLGFTASPFAQVFFDQPAINFGRSGFFWPLPLLWMPVAIGALLSIITLHVAKLLAQAQGWLAKEMLVRSRS